MTRLLHTALISGLTASTDVLLARPFMRRLETLQRAATAPLASPVSVFSTSTTAKRLFH